MMRFAIPFALACATLTGCKEVSSDRPETALEFPLPDRPVSNVTSNQFSTETERDNRGEAQAVMDLAEITPGMTVADIGAGNGYYTVRLAERVGEEGKVLAQDIDEDALSRLGDRVLRERFENVSIKLGAPDDPRLPEDSFDRIFLVHMYHEVQEPYAFLWRLWSAMREGGQVIVVDVDRPTDQHGIDPLLLSCEFEQVGYTLDKFKNAPELAGYYAQFTRAETRPQPSEIKPCREAVVNGEGAG
ncbi:class I SAM-dependent methyltransferase [Erythrobacter sp. W53]|uniref:class I SAM-dependent methyltransferase n=1 Tax=Erythrobacteraceae TaxID=335929 RepID=UPI0036D41830